MAPDPLSTAAHPADRPARAARVVQALKALGSTSARTIFYGSALLTIVALPGADLPGVLSPLAAGLGVEALGSILDRLVHNEQVPPEEIRAAVERAIAESGIDGLVTSDEFQHAIGSLMRGERLIRAAVEQGEYALAGKLADQYTAHQAFLSEVQAELLTVQVQLETLATYDQGEAILNLVEALGARLDQVLPTVSPAQPVAAAVGGLRLLRIFVASPGDVADERARLRRVIDEFNQPGALAEQRGVVLRLLAWEDAVGEMGRPEQVILDQMPVARWDIFVGLLWTRFGSPSGGRDPETDLPYDGGTEEEFRLAYRSWQETGRPHILFYRRTGPPASVDDLDPEQLSRVRAFLKQFEASGRHPGLRTSYAAAEEFERRVRQDLIKLLPRLALPQPPVAAPAPVLLASPAPNHDALERPYLDWLVRVHGRLEMRGLRLERQLPMTVALDRVYVALKGSESSPDELADSRELLDEEARALMWDEPGEDNHWRRLGRVLVSSPLMPSLVERDRPSVFAGQRRPQILNLAEAFRRFRWLVVLGDPGSGKTTLARWLTLHLAQALIEGRPRVQVQARQVDPLTAEDAAPVDLGSAQK